MASKNDQRHFQLNFFYSTAVHVGLIVALFFWSAFMPKQEPVAWMDMGIGGEAGMGGDNGDGKDAPPPAPGDSEPAPAPPGTQSEAPTPIPPAPPKLPKFVVPKDPKPQPAETPEPVKKAEPTKTPPKAQPEATPMVKKNDPSKIVPSNKLIVRPKTGLPNSKTPNGTGTAGPDAKGTSAHNAGRSFDAGKFRDGLMGKLGGVQGGTGTGRKGPVTGGHGISGKPGSGAGDGLLPSQFGWYYNTIRNVLFNAWNQPSQIQGKPSCIVYIRIMRDGRISNVWFNQKSGNPVMDDSVLSAVNSVGRIAPLPPGLGDENGYADIPIEFELKPKEK